VKPGGVSALSDPASDSGAAKAFYYLTNVDILSDNPEEKLGFVKVGDRGKIVRSYTKCCNTVLNTAGGKKFPAGFRPFNRNCIYNSDGSKFDPPAALNIMAEASFNPALVPEPKHKEIPLCSSLLCRFASGICANKCCCCDAGYGHHREGVFMKDPRDVTEIVPITWE
jgi:hypothetical protein